MTAKPRKADEDVFEIWDINAAAMDLFISVQGLWNTVAVASLAGGAVIRLGLDYAGVDAFMRRMKVADELFPDLVEMEAEALVAFGEAR